MCETCILHVFTYVLQMYELMCDAPKNTAHVFHGFYT